MLLETRGADEVDQMLADSDPERRAISRREQLERLGVEVA